MSAAAPLSSSCEAAQSKRLGRGSDGTRQSTAKSFLRPALSRPNFTVLTGAHVSRVIIEEGEAKGIEVVGADGAPSDWFLRTCLERSTTAAAVGPQEATARRSSARRRWS